MNLFGANNIKFSTFILFFALIFYALLSLTQVCIFPNRKMIFFQSKIKTNYKNIINADHQVSFYGLADFFLFYWNTQKEKKVLNELKNLEREKKAQENTKIETNVTVNKPPNVERFKLLLLYFKTLEFIEAIRLFRFNTNALAKLETVPLVLCLSLFFFFSSRSFYVVS